MNYNQRLDTIKMCHSAKIMSEGGGGGGVEKYFFPGHSKKGMILLKRG